MTTKKDATIDAVAALAGVSRATVSRVLNRSAYVSADVAKKVCAAIEATNYMPNAQARLLAGGRRKAVVLVYPAVPFPPTWHFYQTETGVIRGCSVYGFNQKTLLLAPEDLTYHDQLLAPDFLNECEGLILTPPFADDARLIQKLEARGVSVALIAAGSATRRLRPGVGLDDEAAGFAIAEHLISLGHKRFGFIEGMTDHVSAFERLNGVLRGLSTHGIDHSQLLSVPGALTFETGISGFEAIQTSGFAPTAIICANDEMAAGALRSAYAYGLNVPRDISIVGFDDAPFARLLSPPLTTVSQGVVELAMRSVTLILEMVKGQTPSNELTPPQIVLRESTAAPR
ncbi:MAG: LacI family DNA-binding transcriptional regulator [Asticcacaulis sp.]